MRVYDMTDYDSLNYSGSGAGCGCSHSSYSGCGCSSNYNNFSVATAPDPTLLLRPTPYKIEAAKGQFVPNDNKNKYPNNGKYPKTPIIYPTTEMGGTFTDELLKDPLPSPTPPDQNNPRNTGSNFGDYDQNERHYPDPDPAPSPSGLPVQGQKEKSFSIDKKHLKTAAIILAGYLGYKLFLK